LLCAALTLIAVLVFLPPLLGKKRVLQSMKDTPYECGMPATVEHGRFSIKFYLVAMLFILFDIEVVFMLGYASVFSDLKSPLILGQLVLFIALLETGHLYIIKRGALRWAPSHKKVS